MATLTTKLEIKSWVEEPYREQENGKFSRADVVLMGSDDRIEADATFEALLYYPTETTSTWVTLMQLAGTIDGRAGTVVLQGSGTYDGTTARLAMTVAAGTGELAGIKGSAESVSTHADYPNMPLTLTYEFE